LCQPINVKFCSVCTFKPLVSKPVIRWVQHTRKNYTHEDL
jgi:hypothetical protein